MNYFRNLQEYMAYKSGKAEKLVPKVHKEEPKPKRARKKKGDE